MAVTYVRNPETGAFEKIGPGNSTTDITLSVSGKAADAKIVGEVVSGKIAAPASGEVGQVLTVSAINEGGKPIAWETTNMPSIEGLATEAYVDKAIDDNRVTVDAELSADSTNPVQNIVVKAAMDALEGSLNSKITEATSSVVNYTEQTLTEEQKSQARINIGAASESEVDEAIGQINSDIDEINDTLAEHTTSIEEMGAEIATNASAIERLTKGVSAEEVDGVNDLIQYVNEHGVEVTGIKADIQANANAIDALEANAETKTDAQAKLVEAKEYADGQIESHTHSWDDLTDKPFGEETKMVPITWDGDISSKKVKEYGSDNGVCLVYPGVFPTPDDLIGSTVNVLWPVYTEEGQTPVPISVTLTEDMIEYLGDGGYCFNYSNVVYRALAEVRPGDGLYLMYMTSNDEVVYYVTDINYLVPQTVVKPIDIKYLPEHLQNPSWSTVGQQKTTYITTLVPETTFAVEYDGEPTYNPFTIDIIDGQTYTVVFNGTTYNCTAYVAEYSETPSIGNDLVGEAGTTGGNGEPFFCTVYGGEVVFFAEVGDHTISITGPGYSKVIFEKSTVEWGYYEISEEFVENETYLVTWNGTDYICVAYLDADGEVCLGNQSMGNDEFVFNLPSSEPFFMYTQTFDGEDVASLFVDTGSYDEYTLEIRRGHFGGISILPDQYLSKNIARIDDINLKNALGVHYDDVVVYENSSLAFELSASEEDTYASIEHDHQFIEGDVYTVILDGVEYHNLTAYSVLDGGVIVGARHSGEFSNEMPFSIAQFGYGDFEISINVATEALHSLIIIRHGEVLNQLPEEVIPDTIARISDLAQSDWSINDPSNPAYIHNRPFYTTDPTNITLLSGTYSFRQAGDTLYTAQLGTMSQVVAEGQTLSITYDESVHDVVVKTATIDSVTYLCAGNVSILNSMFGTSFTNTNEPFVLIFSNTTSVLYTSAVPSNTAVTIGTVTSEIITIPHEYLGLNVDNGAGDYAVVEGFNTTADGQCAHAEGNFTEASGLAAHAEGSSTRATGATAHAEGTGSVASGDYSHAEGNTTQATKAYAHSEGYYTEATGEYGAHAEGYFAVASGGSSHAEGSNTQATGSHSHAEGFRTIAAGEHQHVEGQYNIEDTESKYIHIAGNGSKDGPVRSNAHTLDWDGNAWFKGDVKVGGTGYDDATNTLASETYVDEAVANAMPSVTTADNGKFLRVVNGVWAAATVPSAEEVLF